MERVLSMSNVPTSYILINNLSHFYYGIELIYLIKGTYFYAVRR